MTAACRNREYAEGTQGICDRLFRFTTAGTSPSTTIPIPVSIIQFFPISITRMVGMVGTARNSCSNAENARNKRHL